MTKQQEQALTGQEVIRLVEAIAKQRNIPLAVVFKAVEQAIAAAIIKNAMKDDQHDDPEPWIEVKIDPLNGHFAVAQLWHVVQSIDDQAYLDQQEGHYLLVDDAKAIDPHVEAGSTLKQDMPDVALGRIDASLAKQVVFRVIKQAERERKAEHYRKNMINEIITAEVKMANRDQIIVDLGDAEGVFKKEDMIPRESIRPGDYIKGLIYDVCPEDKGPLVKLTRSSNAMLCHLISTEVPEVAEGIIQVMGCERIPGERAKLAVKSNDGRIDPVGACVGMSGSRVQSVSNELNGERIDIINWDDQVPKLVANAMAPINIHEIKLDEQAKRMTLVIDEEKLSQAIGRNGQNIRLTSSLVGWELKVISHEENQRRETRTPEHQLALRLDVDLEIASLLVDHGFTRLDQLHDAALLADRIAAFDQDLAEELVSRAQMAMIEQAASNSDQEPDEDLLAMSLISTSLAYEMAKHGIASKQDLADLSVDELMEDISGLNKDDAAAMINEARASWFEEK